MLGLSRQEGEQVRIGDDVVVKVAKIRGNRVDLAFEAPPDVPIHREEVWQAIHREGGVDKKQAARVAQAAKDGTLDKLEADMDHEENQTGDLNLNAYPEPEPLVNPQDCMIDTDTPVDDETRDSATAEYTALVAQHIGYLQCNDRCKAVMVLQTSAISHQAKGLRR